MVSQVKNDGESLVTCEKGSTAKPSHSLVMFAGPKMTVTKRTESTPRGKIFEDDMRGTLFWEVAESSEEERNDMQQQKSKDILGRPFQIEWIKWFHCLELVLMG